jgi:hypothetical protein
MYRSRRRHRRALRLIAPVAIVLLLAGGLLAGLLWTDEETQASLGVDRAAQASAPDEAQCARVHVFRQGETLETIAEQELGAGWHWQEIAVRNRERLDSALQDGLQPGMALEIPVPCAH